MKKIAGVLLLMLIGVTVWGQDIGGQWNGVLKVGSARLRLVFNIIKKDSGFIATMDSPDQGAKGIPVSSVSFNQPQLKIDVSNLNIQYRGELKENIIVGVFSQNGQDFPLDLSREKMEKTTLNRPQVPVKPYPYYEEEVVFKNEKANIDLTGTLTLPGKRGKFPAVILISGSGPQDRDETLMEHKPFLVLADYLTRSGIAVLRYDDRGVGKSKGIFSSSTTQDFASDVEAAINYLKTRQEINKKKVGLVGHSEGGIIAPLVAAGTRDVSFIVMLAGTGVRGDQLLLSQQYLIGKASGASEEDLAKGRELNSKLFAMVLETDDTAALKAGMSRYLSDYLNNLPEDKKPKGITIESYSRRLAGELSGPWLRNFLRYDPATSLENVKCPVLAVNGEKDLQVPAAENLAAIAKALKKAGNKHFTVKTFPGLNHLFQEAGTGSPDEYRLIEQTFSPVALEYITEWIKSQVK
ncbi:alpha/beta hydrolase family protein [Flavihumibacter stibioxidans]|uniref:Serine aminopeptidase S33 domain-containing protein n=1 Tax=Flavihumibacter stibioxidans TaxID=1834163 RepID=A0ABR7M347_9BACT|nr:alpha/beta hydrolase [Flavihumibacter stibioxidans]MBC6489439.1 hypothetical protein [Flavihumibacter stibioxidans]